MGVGASIASGSHVWTGTWADLAAAAERGKGDRAQQPGGQRVGLRDEGVDVVAAQVAVGHQRQDHQPDAAKLRHDQRLDAGADRLRVVVIEGNQRVRAESRNLPEEEEHQEAAGENQPGHGADEKEHQGVIAGQLRLAAHVLAGKDDGETADHGRDDRQEKAQTIGHQGEIAKDGAQRHAHERFVAGVGQQRDCRRAAAQREGDRQRVLEAGSPFLQRPDDHSAQPGQEDREDDQPRFHKRSILSAAPARARPVSSTAAAPESPAPCRRRRRWCPRR